MTPGIGQVHGMGGNGKTLLAEEYALRFGAAWPGGVFWLRLYGNDERGAHLDGAALEAELTRQASVFAQRLGLDFLGKGPEEVRGLLERHLHGRGQHFLWVLDDVPDNLSVETLR